MAARLVIVGHVRATASAKARARGPTRSFIPNAYGPSAPLAEIRALARMANRRRGATPQLEPIVNRIELDLWYINDWTLGNHCIPKNRIDQIFVSRSFSNEP
jgi:hypothetical protein